MQIYPKLILNTYIPQFLLSESNTKKPKMASIDLIIHQSTVILSVKNSSEISTHFYYIGKINSIKWTDLYLILTGYAALSRNGAKEKLRSEATCFSLRSDEARAAASGARVAEGGSPNHEGA